jgi:hypothetical protein
MNIVDLYLLPYKIRIIEYKLYEVSWKKEGELPHSLTTYSPPNQKEKKKGKNQL